MSWGNYFGGGTDFNPNEYQPIDFAHARNSTGQSTTSGAYTQLTGMSLTALSSGTYLVWLEVDGEGDGFNAAGSICIHKNGTIVPDSIRVNLVDNETLLGNTVEIRTSLYTCVQVTLTEGDQVTGLFNELDNDTFIVRGKSMTMIRVV